MKKGENITLLKNKQSKNKTKQNKTKQKQKQVFFFYFSTHDRMIKESTQHDDFESSAPYHTTHHKSFSMFRLNVEEYGKV